MSKSSLNIKKWKDLESIKIDFIDNEFKDCNIIRDVLNVALSDNSDDVLQIQEIDDNNKINECCKKLKSNVNYLLLFNNKDFLFAKKEFSEVGTQKFRKFKFSMDDIKNTTLNKLSNLKFDNVNEFDNLFDKKDIVKKFYDKYRQKIENLSQNINGIESTDDRIEYARILLYRLIFLHFIQTKKILSYNDSFLLDKLNESDDNYYDKFLKVLFFKVLNTPIGERTDVPDDLKTIPFLNGGLFQMHRIESDNLGIKISNNVFRDLLTFLSEWMWYVDEDSDNGEETAVNPAILGNIFEKTITDQKGKGAYYTPDDITNFINNSTIIPFCVAKINRLNQTKYSEDKSGLIRILKNSKHAESLYFDVLKPIAILDNACGSGAFILSASTILFDLYVAAWDKIKSGKSKKILEELKKISIQNSPNYYFKHRIITSNLFGVDKETGAIEICKLRLWLSLISDIDREHVSPLPNIDFNILQGNSILGYTDIPKQLQKTLDGNSVDLKNEIEKIDSLKDEFRNSTDPTRIKKLSEEIQIQIGRFDEILTDFRIKGLDKNTKNQNNFEEKFKLEKPFHWRLHFDSIFTKRHGFDIVVGNPPYVKRPDYPTNFLDTHECYDTFAYFFEISIQLLKEYGRIGYIVPISFTTTKTMSPLQNLLIDQCSELKISNYDDRPGKLFDTLEHCRSSIVLGKRHDDNCKILTTGYNRWFTKDRDNLFPNIQYFDSTEARMLFYIPKIKNQIELNIWKKINEKPTLKSIVKSNNKKTTDFKIAYHDSPQYWIRALNFMPYSKSGNEKFKPIHMKWLYFDNKNHSDIVLAALNSSIFYWFFIKIGGRDMPIHIIENFSIDVTKFSESEIQKIQKILKKLMIDLKKNSEIHCSKRSINNTEIESTHFYPKKSRKIIYELDDIFMNHYKFSNDEINYIKDFDIEFRMGDNTDNEK